MKEIAELLGITLIIVCAVMAVVLLATTPFALIGWAMATMVGLFTTVSVSYFDCVALGIGVGIVTKIIVQAKYK